MPTTDVEEDLARTFVLYAVQRMRRSLTELECCVKQLSEAQMQTRGGEHENSIVNLLLHMEGNLRQWVLHGVAEQPDVRLRDAEFALDAPQRGRDVMAQLRSTIEEACVVVEATTAERLMQVQTHSRPACIETATCSKPSRKRLAIWSITPDKSFYLRSRKSATTLTCPCRGRDSVFH